MCNQKNDKNINVDKGKMDSPKKWRKMDLPKKWRPVIVAAVLCFSALVYKYNQQKKWGTESLRHQANPSMDFIYTAIHHVKVMEVGRLKVLAIHILLPAKDFSRTSWYITNVQTLQTNKRKNVRDYSIWITCIITLCFPKLIFTYSRCCYSCRHTQTLKLLVLF